MKLRTSRQRCNPSSRRKRTAKRDDLDVEVGVGRPDRLHPHLVVLAQPARLGRSYRNAGVAYQTFHGVGGRCSTKARATGAVPSGRSAMRRPPLSSKSYISLVTTSVPSPRRRNTPMSSNMGDCSSPYPAPCATRAKAASRVAHRADSGGMTSWVPLGARNEAVGAMGRPSVPAGTRRPNRHPLAGAPTRWRGGRRRTPASRPGL